MSQDSIQTSNRPDASRSLAYATFSTAFEYPDSEGLEMIRSGVLADALRQLLSGIDPQLVADADWDALRDVGPDDDALQVDFTRLFDAGEHGPICPLNGGSYGGASMATMEELIRFYNYFGLSLPEQQQQQPDHLTTELEFLHYLTFQEAQSLAVGEDAAGLQRAQRDFIVRHPGAWVPAMRNKLIAQQPPRFILELARLLEQFLHTEEIRLTEQIGQLPESDIGE